MVPKAKKNIHACLYHLENLINSKHFEEVEINFAAFVNSARSTTFVLQKEFKKNQKFINWYGNPNDLENIKKKTKLYEMKNDELCQFFLKLRNQIIKEGINNLGCSTNMQGLNSKTDFPNRPTGASLIIGSKGICYHVNKKTAKEDYISATSKTAKITTKIFIANAPQKHLEKRILNPNILEISKLYYQYLKNLVEEWTGLINNAD